jgi:hypothetical protein
VRWTSEEAHELAQKIGIADPELAVRTRARQVLAEAGVEGVPVQFAALFKTMGVRKARPVTMLLEGALRPVAPLGFDILVREDRHARRQRFTIAHELGHLLFYRFAERAKLRQRVDGRKAPAEEERLCNVAAEEFLMPEWFVRKTFESGDDALRCIRSVARDCDVSLEAALIRCAPFVTQKGALQIWSNERGWRLNLARRTGRTRVRLDTFVECDGIGPFINAAARADHWEWHGWLRSLRPSAVTHVSTRTLTAVGGGHGLVLVQHVLSKSGTKQPMGDLEKFTGNLVRLARRTPPDQKCEVCAGSGWVERTDGFARCKCRFEVLAKRRMTG